MAKYLICYALPDHVARYHEDVFADVSRRFGIQPLNHPACATAAAGRRIPPHVTLKAPFDVAQGKPFDTQDIEEVEKAVKTVANKSDPAPMVVEGFERLKRTVLALHVKPSDAALAVQRRLINELRSVLPAKRFYRLDDAPHFHASIVRREDLETCDKVWRYLLKTYKPYFDIELNNLTILRNERKRWYVHRVFYM